MAVMQLRGPGSQSEELALESLVADDPATKLNKARDAELAAAYHFLRKAVAVIALTLPFALLLGHTALDRLFDDGRSPYPVSISGYYYTRMGNAFVGALVALGVFFLSYQRRPLTDGDYRWDRRLCTIASVAAVGVALFPTRGTNAACGQEIGSACGDDVVMGLHLASATTLFVTLGIVAIYCFTKSDGTTTPRKEIRNRIYRMTAYGIFASVAALALRALIDAVTGTALGSDFLIFGFESVCVLLFGLSWAVKAEMFPSFNDLP